MIPQNWFDFALTLPPDFHCALEIRERAQLLAGALPSCSDMLALAFSSLLVALLFVYLFMPALWAYIIALDDSLDAHESGLAVVAARSYCFLQSSEKMLLTFLVCRLSFQRERVSS